MTVFTMFHSTSVESLDDHADDVRFTKDYKSLARSLKLNILQYKEESVKFSTVGSHDVELFTGSTDAYWWVLYAKVLGEARFSVNYDDPANPGTTITSNISAYGDVNFPGIYSQTLLGLKVNGGSPAIRITALQAPTNVQFFLAQAAADNNAIWIANK